MEIKLPRVCTIEAPCKINLHLKIGEKRSDGFHSLESIFATLALADMLRFERAGEEGKSTLEMKLELPGEVINPEKNLVLRAVSLFREQTGFKPGLHIRLDKRIPIGAGLGGGSSDAASTLLALNSLACTALPMEKLREMAILLGSDVPFFLTGGAAFVSGRGEQVETIKSPVGLWVVLVKPPFSSDTACAYRLLDQVREHAYVSDSSRIEPLVRGAKAQREGKLSKDALIRHLEDDPGTWPFHNDFLPVFLDSGTSQGGKKGANAEAYRAVLEDLRKAGASFTGLSGSGSCCFGIFCTKETAERAESTLGETKNNVKLTFFLAQKANPVLK